MCVDVADMHAQTLGRSSELLRARGVLVRPDRTQHDQICAQLQLCMPDELAGLRYREQLDETEAVAQQANRGSGVIVSEDGKDRLHDASFAKRPVELRHAMIERTWAW